MKRLAMTVILMVVLVGVGNMGSASAQGLGPFCIISTGTGQPLFEFFATPLSPSIFAMHGSAAFPGMFTVIFGTARLVPPVGLTFAFTVGTTVGAPSFLSGGFNTNTLTGFGVCEGSTCLSNNLVLRLAVGSCSP